MTLECCKQPAVCFDHLNKPWNETEICWSILKITMRWITQI